MTIARRSFLKYAGLGSVAALLDPEAAWSQAANRRRPRSDAPVFFEPINPSADDRLLLPAGYRYEVVAAWGDDLGSRAAATRIVHTANGQDFGIRQGDVERFGFNCDFLAYFPLDALTNRGGRLDSRDGLLWVNHEFPDPLFVSDYSRQNYRDEERKMPEQVIKEMLSVGGTVIRVKRGDDGRWRRHPDERTRRVTAISPEFEVTGPARDLVLRANPEGKCFGSLANCSGGRTPWFTALSCEENYPDYNESDKNKGGFRWKDLGPQVIFEQQYGWVCEIDPYGELPPKKHTSLGHFKHENAAVRFNGPNRKLVVYMGDDESDQHFYKFVSDQPYNPDATRAEKSQLLSNGKLFVAKFDSGEWLEMSMANNNLANKTVRVTHATDPARDRTITFSDQGTILMHCREAAKLLEATPLDRPEDCEVHPRDGSVYIAMSNNQRRANFHGQIVRLIEHNDNPEGRRFQFEIYLVGGRDSGMSCPDNLMFDSRGNLWVGCDIGGGGGRGPHQPFGNNGIFVVPTIGANAGDAFQFASGPVGCELTGPWMTEDEETLFLAVQHPGEGTTSRDRPTSRWPRGGNDIPRPSVVAITGFRW
jgi:secreted PhoX family phosphatase